MSTLQLLTCLVGLAVVAGARPARPAEPAEPTPATQRFLVERTFPPGALAGLDATAKASVNANNAELGVAWVRSYANAEQTKTYCVYEGPDEEAVRAAAKRNGIPVDAVFAIPVDLEPGPLPDMVPPPRRYLVERTFPPQALDGLDDAAKAAVNATNAELGVRWLHSYANADRTRTYCVYEAPSEAAVREAAARNGIPVDAVTEVPVDLLPR